MAVKHCFFANCHSDSRKKVPGIFFVPFPKYSVNRARCKQWLILSKRKGYRPQDIKIHHYVCNKHFPSGVEISRHNLDLTPFAANAPPEKLDARALRYKARDDARPKLPSPIVNKSLPDLDKPDPKLKKKTSEPEELSYSFAHNLDSFKTYERKRKSEQPLPVITPTVLIAKNIALDPSEIDIKCQPVQVEPKVEIQPAKKRLIEAPPVKKIRTASKSVQVNIGTKTVITALKKQNKDLKECLKCAFAAQIKSSDSKCLYYTGLNNEGRTLLYKFLDKGKEDLILIGNKKAKKTRELKINLENQFLLTLVKLRRNFQYEDLANRFGTHSRLASQIFKTWVQFMYWKFNEIRSQLFIKSADLSRPLPSEFQNPYLSQARCVLETFEFRIENSKNQFKTNTSTCKVLVAITPAGSFAFATDCFDGKTKDRELVRVSNFWIKFYPTT